RSTRATERNVTSHEVIAGGTREANSGGDQRKTAESRAFVSNRHFQNVERTARSARIGRSFARSAGRPRQFCEQPFYRSLRFRPDLPVSGADRRRPRGWRRVFGKD